MLLLRFLEIGFFSCRKTVAVVRRPGPEGWVTAFKKNVFCLKKLNKNKNIKRYREIAKKPWQSSINRVVLMDP